MEGGIELLIDVGCLSNTGFWEVTHIYVDVGAMQACTAAASSHFTYSPKGVALF